MIRCAVLGVALIAALAAARPADAQPACAQPLATTSVDGGSFATVNAREFEGRVYLYAPRITGQGKRFEPFDLWVIEGVYGRPFVQSSGSMDAAAFERLRKNTNVRATAVRVQQDGQTGRVAIARQTYMIDVNVATPGTRAATVTARMCRGR